MAVTSKVLIAAKRAENAQTTQYTAVNCRAIVDKFTVTNTTASNVTFSANVVSSGGTASDSNIVIDGRAIAPNETYIGKALDIDEEGLLIVDRGGEKVKVIAGDVSIRSAQPEGGKY